MKKEIIKRIEDFRRLSLTFYGYNQDNYWNEHNEMIKELEKKYNCKIDDTFDIEIEFKEDKK